MRYNKWVYYCMSLKRLPTPKTCVELFFLLGRQRYQNFDVLSLSLYTFSFGKQIYVVAHYYLVFM
jgi:hypothetical protein